MPQLKSGSFNADEFIHEYYQSLMYVNETMGLKRGTSKKQPSKEEEEQKEATVINLQNMKYLDPSFVDQYKEAGERYLYELKKEFRAKEVEEQNSHVVTNPLTQGVKVTSLGGTKDAKRRKAEKLHVAAEEIMSMTPAQKQEFLAKRKQLQKRETEDYEKRRDPQTLILERKQSACKAHLEAKNPVDVELTQEEKDKIASLQHKQEEKIKEALGGASETLAFQQTLQWTFQQYRKMNRFYEAEQLKDKIKERGSLYGVPSTEFSQEKEIAELIMRMPTMITKPNNLFDKGELEAKYQIFLEKTKQMQMEEDLKAEREAAKGLARKQGSSMGTKRNGDLSQEEMDPFNNAFSPSKLMGASVLLSSNQHQLAVGKPKKQIVQSLDQKEKDALRSMIQEESEMYEHNISKKYHDRFNCKLHLLVNACRVDYDGSGEHEGAE